MGAICSGSHDPTYNPHVLSMAHYEVHRVIGKGGFGKVNAVIQKNTTPPKWFALKALSKVVILKKNCKRMVWNERNLLAIVKSPHVVMMHHAFQDQYNCYVVMDLLLGGDLKFQLGSQFKTGFREDHARFYVAGLLLALRDLHAIHILHRDVKPENVILDNQGYPRLTDLGVSVKTETLRYKGDSGTPSYMAPELFNGSHEHGVAADFYALGIMAHELLYGKRPWSGTIQARLEATPDFANDLPPHREGEFYPADLLDITASSPLSLPCRALLRGLLHPVERHRLGFKGGVAEIMEHAWFSGFDWAAYEAKTVPPPFLPKIDDNAANCDTAVHDFDDVLERSSRQSQIIKPQDQEHFIGFEFNVDLRPETASPQPLPTATVAVET